MLHGITNGLMSPKREPKTMTATMSTQLWRETFALGGADSASNQLIGFGFSC